MALGTAISSPDTIQWLAATFGTLMFAAVGFEYVRQSKNRKRHRLESWKTLEAIAREKELTPDEKKLLENVAKRWSPDDPHHMVSVRHTFDKAVESEMEQIKTAGDLTAFEQAGVLLRDIRGRLALDYVPLGQRIHSTRELFTGQEIWISRVSAAPPKWIRGSVASIDEAYLGVRIVGATEERPVFERNEELRVRLWREEDARYMFTVRFAREDREPPALLFYHTSELTRVQARDFYRVRYEQNVTIGILNAPVDGNTQDTKDRQVVTKLRGRITNISAGGLALVAPQAIPTQVLIRVTLEFNVSGLEPVTVDARLVSSAPLSGGRHLVRATFTGIDDQAREAIAHFVMHRQQAFLDPSLPKE
ncbi:MAG: PilZ domain-containing protein [Candidatus Hydrogenedentes bacterium]|nr:PilZ domain-containing protein [Candidatus Hydrogenedentota bacterium]